MSLQARPATGNLLLNALSAGDFALLAPHLRRVPLPLRWPLYRPDEPIEECYFPEGGVSSIVAVDEEDQPMEVGLSGREGLSAVPVLLGSDRSPNESFVQIAGPGALVMPVGELIDALEQSPTMRTLLLRFAHVMAVQAGRTAHANARYTLAERLARWLLMCHDRVDGDEFLITHDFMALMLGVRRSGVTLTLHILEGAHAIRARRGRVEVTNRATLEELAGGTYGVPEAEYRRLIAPLGKAVDMVHDSPRP